MARWAGTVIGLAAAALVVACVAFGLPALVIGGPLFVGVVGTLVVLLVTERPRRALVDRRDGRTADTPWRTASERGEQPSAGLMSGFFEISPQVQVPPIGEYRIPEQATSPDVTTGPRRGGPEQWLRQARTSRAARPARV